MTTRNLMSRRTLLGAGAGAAATAALGTRATPAASGADAHAATGPVLKRPLLPPERIGLQLYSLSDQVSSLGFAKVFETVAEIGFKVVEFAGYTQGTGDISVKEIRSLLDANGLEAVGSHVSPSDDETMKAIIEDALVLGIPQVGLSLLTPSGPPTVSGWSAAAESYNRYGQLGAERGIRFYMHNHFQEWLPLPDSPDKRGLDILLEETDPKLVDWQMDIFWSYCGAAQSLLTPFDPIEDYLLPHRERIRLFHVKDGLAIRALAGITDVGEGEIDFQAFFDRLFAQAPGQDHKHHYLWERDNAGDHPRGSFAAARASFVNMRYGLFAPATAANADGAFRASILRTDVTRDSRGRRVLEVTVKLSGAADVTARLSRGGTRLARSSRHLRRGTRRLEVAIPRSVDAGNARLDLLVSNGEGVSLSLRETVRVPSARRRR